jgi:hypothetical protein
LTSKANDVETRGHEVVQGLEGLPSRSLGLAHWRTTSNTSDEALMALVALVALGLGEMD